MLACKGEGEMGKEGSEERVKTERSILGELLDMT